MASSLVTTSHELADHLEKMAEELRKAENEQVIVHNVLCRRRNEFDSGVERLLGTVMVIRRGTTDLKEATQEILDHSSAVGLY